MLALHSHNWNSLFLNSDLNCILRYTHLTLYSSHKERERAWWSNSDCGLELRLCSKVHSLLILILDLLYRDPALTNIPFNVQNLHQVSAVFLIHNMLSPICTLPLPAVSSLLRGRYIRDKLTCSSTILFAHPQNKSSHLWVFLFKQLL